MDNLDNQLDRLYALEPSAFVAERDRLARELRDAGLREEAEHVKRLRKPSLSAATINQLTRQERREVDLLLDAGHRLREAQQRLLAGEDPGSLDEARRTEREALSTLRRAAARILDDAGRKSQTTLNRIMGTLQAAAVSSEGRELLARGRLTTDLEAPGFDLLAPLAEGTPKRKRTAPKRPAPPRKTQQDRRRVERAQAQLRKAQAIARTAEENLRAAERDAEKARRELERAEKQLREAEGKK